MVHFTNLLRSSGISVTVQRLAVLDVVSQHPHSTADFIIETVRAELGTISKQAVYNVLGTLVEHGLLRRIQPSGSPALYENRTGDNHHHLICRSCGVTHDINCAVGHRPCLTAEVDHGFQIDEAEVIYWGQCPVCLSKK
ncbi:MAG: Fur family transcriptional regulator [Akkermansiaceae bacterium]